MKNFYLFILILMAATSSLANEVNTKLSGFIAGTVFGDERFYPNKANASLNIDIDKDDFAIRTQIAIPYDNPIRRFVVEKSMFIKQNQELTVQVGRFPRLDSFYNPVTDAPGTTNLAMLPLAQYNRRILENRSFNSIDGIRLLLTQKTENGIIDYHFNYGDAAMDDLCNVQIELTKKPCTSDFTFKTQNANYEIGFATDYGKWKTFAFVSSARFKTHINNSSNPKTVALANIVNRLQFDIYKLGIKYDTYKWWAQSEYLYTDLNLASPNASYKSVQTSDNIYLLTGVKWYENFNTYLEYSYGKSNTGKPSIDRAIGTTYINSDVTYSLEYHSGDAIAWKRYFSPITDWNTWVFSVTKRF